MSTDAQASDLKAILTTAATGDWAVTVPAEDLDEIKARSSLPANYVEVYLSRRFGGPARADGTRPVELRRLSTRVVASSVTNGRVIEDRIADAFAFSTVTVAGEPVHVAYESGGGDFEYDDGKYVSQLTDWTF